MAGNCVSRNATRMATRRAVTTGSDIRRFQKPTAGEKTLRRRCRDAGSCRPLMPVENAESLVCVGAQLWCSQSEELVGQLGVQGDCHIRA